MNIKLYQVDAFASHAFEGNPAAVCPLKAWLSDDVMQAIAQENNLSETAFFVPAQSGFDLRWFTPVAEVNLCGHATLASAHVLFEQLGYKKSIISFFTRSGKLKVKKVHDRLEMDFPVRNLEKCKALQMLIKGLGASPDEVLAADDYLAVFKNEEIIKNMKPDFLFLAQVPLRGVIVTAPGNKVDFVSRFFAPKLGINEDPVTGSAHCELTPYWTKKLGKNKLKARQVSRRGGSIDCELKDDRVLLSGQAVTFMEGKVTLHL